MEVVVDNLAATTNVGITSDGYAVNRVDSTSAHRYSLIDFYLSTKLSHNDTTLRQAYHIAERMGKDVYFYPPLALLKTIFEPFNAHITLKPLNHICLRYFTR